MFSYEFASPVIQYEFECFRKTDSVFFFFFGVSQKGPKYSVFIFFACYLIQDSNATGLIGYHTCAFTWQKKKDQHKTLVHIVNVM